jgi:transketolase
MKMSNYVREDLSETGDPDREVLLAWMDRAKEDESVVFVGADSIWYLLDRHDKTLKPWFRSDPDRMRRVVMCGIQEANAALVSAGLAAEGFKVYWPQAGGWGAWLYERAYQMIAYSICIERYNVTMVGGATGLGWGPTHQNLRDIATFSAIPNMIVTAPADSVEAKKIALFAYKYIGPIYIRAASPAYSSEKMNIIFEDEYEYHLGKAPVVRDGEDVTVIGMQEWVYRGILAADQLAKEGIDVRVIDMSTIKPIDREAITKAAKETGAIVTAETTNIHGGLGSAVAGVVVENHPVPMKRFAIHDLYTPDCCYGPQQDLGLNKYYRQTVEDLAAAVKETVNKK